MRLVVTLVVILLLAGLVGFLRDGADFPITQTLPLLGGHPPGMYDVAAGAMILISLWGVWRLARRRE